jgi:hypothetical protein
MDDTHQSMDLTPSNSLLNEGIDPLNPPYGLEGTSSLPGGSSIADIVVSSLVSIEPQEEEIPFSVLDNKDFLTGQNDRTFVVGSWEENRSIESKHEVVFVDPGVEDYQSLLAGVNPNAEIVVLDGTRDGVSQIGDFLAQENNVSAVHLVAHGKAGSITLGNVALNSNNLAEYAGQLQQWASALTEDADILFYVCNVAQGSQGEAFVEELSQLTGADIAASDDLTGAVSLGGDWDLEVNRGTIETPVVFNNASLQAYDGLLAVSVTLAGSIATFTGDANGDRLYLRVNGNNQLEFSTDGNSYSSDIDSAVTGIQPLVISSTTVIEVNLGEGADRVDIDSSLNNALKTANASLNFIGGSGSDTLSGSNTDNTWAITDVAAGEGNLNNVITFSGTENLFGGTGNDTVVTDALNTEWNKVIDPSLPNAYNIVSNGASILFSEVNSAIGVTGNVLDDIQTFFENLGNELEALGSDIAEFINNGIATLKDLFNGAANAFLEGVNYAQVLYTSTLQAANLFIQNIIAQANDDFLFSSIDSAHVRIQSSPILSDDLILERIQQDQLRVRTVTNSDIIDFAEPSESLTINMGLGDDKITISPDAPLELNASLTINGGFGFDPDLPFVDYLDGNDTVIFPSNLRLFGKDLNVLTENITVGEGVTISTQLGGENSGNIDLTGTVVNINSDAKLLTKAIDDDTTSGNISIAANVKDFSGIFPIDVFPSADVSVNIASGVEIEGGEVSIEASKSSQTAILPILLVAVQSKQANINIRHLHK